MDKNYLVPKTFVDKSYTPKPGREDYCTTDGKFTLPASKLPRPGNPERDGDRPENKTVTWLSRIFEVSFFHDGGILNIKIKS